jgi:ketol-acid reductoisomerase
MRTILDEIRSGAFAASLADEAAAGYPLLRAARGHSAGLGVERTRERLAALLKP